MVVLFAFREWVVFLISFVNEIILGVFDEYELMFTQDSSVWIRLSVFIMCLV